MLANSSAACQCGAGFSFNGSVCIQCRHGTYSGKGAVGACSACPSASNTTGIGATALSECKCVPGYQGDATVTQLTSQLRSCSGGSLCPTGAFKSYGGASMSVLPVDGDRTTLWASNGQDVTGYIWWRMDFQTQRTFSKVVMWNNPANSGNMGYFQIWIGSDASFPGTNQRVYTSPNANVIVSEAVPVSGSGRYLYIASQGIQMSFAEIDILSIVPCGECAKDQYCPGGVENYTVACPNSQYSLVGASSVSQCGCPPGASLLPTLNCTCNNGTYKVLDAIAPLGGWKCSPCPATKY
jgi:hypothetical protein